MTDQNYADLQRCHDAGEVTLAEARRLGATHAAYGWACTPPPAPWTDEQREAYREGFNEEARFRRFETAMNSDPNVTRAGND